jgi:hypothetical protein
MNQNLCEIGFVLDRSGSMNAMKVEAIGGINAFLESQRKLPGEARLTLVLFDHEYIVAHDGVPIKEVPHSIITAISPVGLQRCWMQLVARSTRSASVLIKLLNRTGPAK